MCQKRYCGCGTSAAASSGRSPVRACERGLAVADGLGQGEVAGAALRVPGGTHGETPWISRRCITSWVGARV